MPVKDRARLRRGGLGEGRLGGGEIRRKKGERRVAGREAVLAGEGEEGVEQVGVVEPRRRLERV